MPNAVRQLMFKMKVLHSRVPQILKNTHIKRLIYDENIQIFRRSSVLVELIVKCELIFDLECQRTPFSQWKMFVTLQTKDSEKINVFYFFFTFYSFCRWWMLLKTHIQLNFQSLLWLLFRAHWSLWVHLMPCRVRLMIIAVQSKFSIPMIQWFNCFRGFYEILILRYDNNNSQTQHKVWITK